MRDREGVVQVVVDPDMKDIFPIANQLRNDSVSNLLVIRVRPDSQVNKDMAAGEVELYATGLEIINRSEALPLDFNQTNS